MNSFNFDDRQVEICGSVYSIDFDKPDMGKYAEKVQAELEKMKDGGKLTKKAIDAFKEFIDLFLGDGSFDKIFENREVSMTGLSKLLIFLTGEMVDEAKIYKNIDTSSIEEVIKKASENNS